MSGLWPRFGLAAALLLYMAQTLPQPAARWVEDESWYGAVAWSLYQEGRIRNPTFEDSDLQSKADPRPPLMPITVAASYRLFGVGPVQARLPGLAAGAGIIICTYLLGAALVHPAAGAVAALLIASDNFLIITARTVRPDIFAALFSALAVLWFAMAGRKRPVFFCAAAGVTAGIAFNYHVNGLPVLAALALALAWEDRWRFWKDARFWALCVGFAAAVLPMILWVRSSPDLVASFHWIYGRGKKTTLEMLLLQEGSRYSDLIGLTNRRFNLPFPLPLRLHIVLAMAAALAWLLWRQRKLGVLLTALAVTGLPLWAIELNPSVRFFAVPAAFLALALAAAAYSFAGHSLRFRLALAALGIVWCTQLAGNALVMKNSRQADYATLTLRLREAIPAGQTVYGAPTFWMALHDRFYRAYNHCRLEHAVNDLRIDYIISNDRLLLHGSGFWEDSFAGLRQKLETFLPRHATLERRIPDPFYGDLEIWRVRYDTLRPQAAP